MKNYLCYRATIPPTINGQLTDPAWQDAPWTDTFVDIEGDLKPLPPFRTRVKMLWDDDYFYIGAEMEEPHVWGTLTEHDSVIFMDNDFEVFIDPDWDNHEYYEIEINALNTIWDLRLVKPYRDGGPALNEWHVPGMRTAVHIDGTLNDPSDTDKGWSVEMAIPWNVLREYANRPSPPQNGDQWKVNFSRVEWDTEIIDGQYVKIPDRPEHNWVWSPQGVIDMHRPEKWGVVQFVTEPIGTAVYREDISLGAREFLMQAYYAQQDFKKRSGGWAVSLEELNLADVQIPNAAQPPQLELINEDFVVSLILEDDSKIHIRGDSKIWRI
ncbi:hypothetical protein EON80_06760 [bacterium]|nr:MAG: hypothetical protein EON80_06760 [bacterium]